MNIKERLDMFSSKAEIYEINGQQANFYPISTSMAFKLKSIAHPLLRAVATLFDNGQQDTGSIMEEVMDESGKNVVGKKTSMHAIEPEMAKLRSLERDRALGELIDSVADPLNQNIIGRLIMDSMRDDFPRSPNNDDVTEFMTTIDATVLVGFLKGVAKANAKIFGPLGERVSATIETQLRGMELRANQTEPNQQETPG